MGFQVSVGAWGSTPRALGPEALGRLHRRIGPRDNVTGAASGAVAGAVGGEGQSVSGVRDAVLAAVDDVKDSTGNVASALQAGGPSSHHLRQPGPDRSQRRFSPATSTMAPASCPGFGVRRGASPRWRPPPRKSLTRTWRWASFGAAEVLWRFLGGKLYTLGMGGTLLFP